MRPDHTSERAPMFSFSRVKFSLLAPWPPEASFTAFSRAGASVPTSVSSGRNLAVQNTARTWANEVVMMRRDLFGKYVVVRCFIQVCPWLCR